ncbi:hypothetical protein, partial [Brevundimonas sp.]|uniref:hypothetical protein n=1 Tax=Brevundimonas sp. TaxID=1871086 RepID=UPI0028A5DCDD
MAAIPSITGIFTSIRIRSNDAVAVLGRFVGAAEQLQHLARHEAVGGVVVHHQHMQGRMGGRVGHGSVIAPPVGLGQGQAQVEAEPCSALRRALDAQAAFHAVDDLA